MSEISIRPYTPKDEAGWVRCRLLAFLDTSYFRDVKRQKETYAGDSICMVAEDQGQIVGILDVEINDKDNKICMHSDGRPGCVIWHLAVLPEYRNKHIATRLWQAVLQQLIRRGVSYCEVWTQEDPAANAWYQHQGFQLLEKDSWLRCQIAEPMLVDRLSALAAEKMGKGYMEEAVFQAVLAERSAVEPFCSHVDEVRLYAMELSVD